MAVPWRCILLLAAFSGSEASNDASLHAFDVRLAVSCRCDLLQLECLPSRSCLDSLLKGEDQRIAEGVALRSELRRHARLHNRDANEYISNPVGKSLQYGTIDSWRSWAENCGMYVGYSDDPKSENCQLSGRCYFASAVSGEDLQELEHAALRRHPLSKAAKRKTYQALERFRRRLTEASGVLPAEQYLLSFAHILRMRFHRLPATQEEYRQHDSEINPGQGQLRVALHIRRADACQSKEYEKHPYDLSSRAQVSTVRTCFDTAVYVDILRRLRQKYGRSMQVFMATDDSRNVLDDIKKSGGNASLMEGARKELLTSDAHVKAFMLKIMDQLRQTDPDIYATTSWRMLNFSRESFRYEGMIDEQPNLFMMRTAVAELWHLSHGEVFVGHLGSRFGKIGYMLAAARHNSALPYVSVDGHNLCCEVDEAMRTMVDCLAYAHETSGRQINSDYWAVGSTIRSPVKLEATCDRDGKALGYGLLRMRRAIFRRTRAAPALLRRAA